jgi:ribosomal protein S12 methylthiotransferase
VGVFTYSHEEGTPAVKLDDHLPDHVKRERQQILMQVQQEVAFSMAQAKIGREVDLVIDAVDPEEDRSWIARTTADAPEIDTVTFVTGKGLRPGQFVRARVINTIEYDLVAEAISKPW